MEQLTSTKQRKDAELAETQRASAAAMWEHELIALRDKLDKAQVKSDESSENEGEGERSVKSKPERKAKKKTKQILETEENS
jgi:hypothetical protein